MNHDVHEVVFLFGFFVVFFKGSLATISHILVKYIPAREEQVRSSDAISPLFTFSFYLHLQTSEKEANFQYAISKQAVSSKVILEGRNMHLLLKLLLFCKEKLNQSALKLVSATCPQSWQRRPSHLQST